MDFDTSTHKARWIFEDQKSLAAKRAEAQQKAAETAKRSREATPADGGDDGAVPPEAKKQRVAEPPVSPADEQVLRRYFETKLRAVCDAAGLPPKVQATATAYFKRFYTCRSCLEHDPARIMPTCAYLAAKVEEAYIGAEDFCKKLGLELQAVLRTEVPLLQGLGFDLVVHSPYRALNGLLQELKDLRAQRSPALDPELLNAPTEAVQQLQRAATKAVAAILGSDAPLLYPPGVLALAALRSGARSAGLPCTRLLEHAVGRAAAVRAADREREARLGEDREPIPGGANPPPARLHMPGGSGGGGAWGGGPEGVQQLLAWLGEVDALVVAAMQEDNGLEARARDIDRAIKLWRKAAASGGGGSGGGGPAGASAVGGDGTAAQAAVGDEG